MRSLSLSIQNVMGQWASSQPPYRYQSDLLLTATVRRLSCAGMLRVAQSRHLEDRAAVCELWWRACRPAAVQTMPYSLIFRGHGLRESQRAW